MELQRPPGTLSLEGNLSENWRVWIQKFDIYLIASGIAEKSEKIKCATFLHVAGDDAIKVYNTFEFDDDVDDLDCLKELFKSYCEPRKNLTYQRHLFFTRAQGNTESIDAYVTDLKNKAKDCEFGDLTESVIRDRVVCGITNDQIHGRLLREPELSLQRAVDICRASEVSQTQLKKLHEETEVPVQKLHKQKTYGKKERPQAQPKTEKTQTDCGRCGYKHEPRKCPAFGQTCNSCHRKNHYAKMCRGRTEIRRKVQGIERDPEGEDDMFIGTIELKQEEKSHVNTLDKVEEQTNNDDWTAKLNINNQTLTVLIDTGANCNVISKRELDALNMSENNLHKSCYKLVGFFGKKVKPLGQKTISCKYKDKELKVDFQVVKHDAKAVLGKESSVAFGMVKRVYAVEERTQTDILSEYEDLFEGLGCVPGVHHIQVNPAVAPVVHPPRKVPVALRKDVEKELKRMENLGVIEKQTEPTEWVSSMVTVVKPNKIRICLDPQNLNKAILREHYPLKTVEEVVAEMPRAKVFSVVDANQGYWQIQLDDESSKLCTFNSPSGRYRFKRLPFGISSAPEVFQRCLSQHLEGLEGVVNVMDDILVWGEDKESHDNRLRKLLDRLRSINLKLNRKKCKIGLSEISYIGHVLSKDGLKPDMDKVRAIQEIPQPKDKTELQRFMGMVQYLGKFIPNLSEVSAPLRKLLEGETIWHWESEQQKSFTRLQELVSNTPVLQYYDVEKPVTLSVDASSGGLGAVILQEQHPVAYGSRTLTECEQRYAQIEKELLAIVYGCEKFHQYLFGRCVQVESDHKPLETIFKKPLHKAPARLQKMLMRLQKYNLQVTYKPGKEMHIADALSRASLRHTTQDGQDDELDVSYVVQQLPVSEEKSQQFKNATKEDEELCLVRQAVQNGWPDSRSQVPKTIQKYWTFREELTFSDGLLFKNSKLVVPTKMREEMLEKIHEAHMGIVKCKERARDILFWPGMAKQIEEVVQKCAVCNKHKNNNPREPLVPHQVPSRAWSKVGIDLFHFNNAEYIMCVDYYSKYPEISKLSGTTSKHIVTALKSIFARHGVPDELFSDNGTQLISAEMRDFATTWEFRHTTSSPEFPQSNGQAERAIQTVKNLLKKAQESCRDPYIALLEYRNTPLDGVGYSPAQLPMAEN